MKKVYFLSIFLVLNLISTSLFADRNDYLEGFRDGEQFASEPICLQVMPEICDDRGNLLAEEDRVYNGEPRCYIDTLERCYEIKEKNSVSKKRFRRLKNKQRKLK